MHHAELVTTGDFAAYAQSRPAEEYIPELVSRLIKVVVYDLTRCRIPHTDAIGLSGPDGIVETVKGYPPFVPAGISYWEIGTGDKPQDKATNDYKKRTKEFTKNERAKATFVVVTPHSTKWPEQQQRAWRKKRLKDGWKDIKIIDGVQLADWLRESPYWGKWFLTKIGKLKETKGITLPTEHWDNLRALVNPGESLPAQLFLEGRGESIKSLVELFEGKIEKLYLWADSDMDVADFVAAFLANTSAPPPVYQRCLLISEVDAWNAMVEAKLRQVLVAHPSINLDSSGEQLYLSAKRLGHGVLVPLLGAAAAGAPNITYLKSPSAAAIEKILLGAKFTPARAKQLAGAGAQSLASLKRFMVGLPLPPYASWQSAPMLAKASLAGRWSGKSKADRAAMGGLVGKKYEGWIEKLRPEALRSDTPLSQHGEEWKIFSRGEAWVALGAHVSDADLDRLGRVAVKVLGENDPKFKLPEDARLVASLHGKNRQHSSGLREGLAETLALLGANPKALTSVSIGKAESVTICTVRKLLATGDWRRWASLNHELPLLAEAAPEEFLHQVEAALQHPKAPFKKIFAQEGDGITGGNYMTGLLWALETLGWSPKYMASAVSLLGELATIDPGGKWTNRPINSISSILLPWHPQTMAPIPNRKAAVEALLREQPEIGWKVLFDLLPSGHGFTTGSRKPAWQPFVPANYGEGVLRQEYVDQITAYADVAATLAADDVPRLNELIDRLPDLPDVAWNRILAHLGSDAVRVLPDETRVVLWESLTDLASKHKMFADAKWALAAKKVAELTATAAKLAPKSPFFLHRRLFSDRDHNLFDHKGDYTEQRQALDKTRDEVIREIHRAGGTADVLKFARLVASPAKVGESLGRNDDLPSDTDLLPGLLESSESVERAVVRGFVWQRFWIKRVAWVASLDVANWKRSEMIALFALLPFIQEVWTVAEKVMGDGIADYWKAASVNPWNGESELMAFAAEKLLANGRPRAALLCLYELAMEKKPLPTELAIRTLLAAVPNGTENVRFDTHEVGEIIERLQEDSTTDQDGLFKVEWAYMPLLDPDFAGSPRTMAQRIADSPEFFLELIQIVFRSKKENKKTKPSPERQRQAENAYRLLRAWRIVPGMDRAGAFAPSAFAAWVVKAKQLATKSGHLQVALNELGQTLPYGPPDPSGLWVHSTIANVLNEKDAGAMRSGFTMELFNQRGVHGFTHGAAETDLAKGFYTKAEELELAGFPRLASSVRDLAKSYERDAEREARRDEFED
jgi:hypothetical protein